MIGLVHTLVACSYSLATKGMLPKEEESHYSCARTELLVEKKLEDLARDEDDMYSYFMNSQWAKSPYWTSRA